MASPVFIVIDESAQTGYGFFGPFGTERDAEYAASDLRSSVDRTMIGMIQVYELRSHHPAVRTNRIAYGKCVLEDGRCATHNVADTMEHHFDVKPDAYND